MKDIYRNEDQISYFNRSFSSQVSIFNSLAEIFNTAHDGIDITWNKELANLLLNRGISSFRSSLSQHYKEYQNKAPVFLRENVKNYCNSVTEDLFIRIDNINSGVSNKIHNHLSELGLSGGLSAYFNINDDGSLSVLETLTQAIQDRYTVNQAHEESEIVQKIKQFIENENELKQLLNGGLDYVLSSQKGDFYRSEHKFNLIPLVEVLKKIKVL